MADTQHSTRRCLCGHLLAVTPTDDPWRFTVDQCPACRRVGILIAWRTAAPPPVFEAGVERLPFES